MTDEKKSFSVKDRRMFTPDGEVRRSDDEAADDKPPAAADRPPAAADRPSAAADRPPAAADRPPASAQAAESPPPKSGAPSEPQVRRPAPEGEAAGEPPIDFGGFLFSLAAQGMQALQGDEPRLSEARAMVSILEMLADKTEGRRTPEESELLDALLYQLRMGYLERRRAGGA